MKEEHQEIPYPIEYSIWDTKTNDDPLMNRIISMKENKMQEQNPVNMNEQ